MAIDTAKKRFSIQNVSMPWRGVVIGGVAPVTAPDRAAHLFQYSGIALGAPSVTVGDKRTVGGRVLVAFTSGDQFRVRAIRTEGGSDLQTVIDGSALAGVVFRN